MTKEQQEKKIKPGQKQDDEWWERARKLEEEERANWYKVQPDKVTHRLGV